MATGSYQLDLDPPRQNVFVTQLHQREEEDDKAAYPIVKESASKLLETGLNTLQKTLLLKKEVEVDRVDEELQKKRDEFQQRMDTCSEKQIDIQKRQQKMKDRVTKFDKFIKENEAKRRRAIQKYQQEVKLKEQKDRELEILSEQLDELKSRNDALKNKLAKYEKFKNYLLQVVDILPANYLEVQDSMLTSLMMRHRTLSDTNITLVENLQTMADETERLKVMYEEYKQEHNKMKFATNSQLSQKQKSQEVGVDKNQEKEQKFLMMKTRMREQRSEFGQIIMAIDNLSEKCVRSMDPDLATLETEEKLDVIRKYMEDKSGVIKMAQRDLQASPVEQKPVDPNAPKSVLKRR